MTREELKDVLKRLQKVKGRLDAVQKEYDGLKDQCKAYMEANKLEDLEINGFKLAYPLVVSTTLDAKTLKAELPKVYAQYARMKESRRFTVTLPV